MSARVTPHMVRRMNEMLGRLEEVEIEPDDIVLNYQKEHVALLFDAEKIKSPVQLDPDEVEEIDPEANER